ncbi:flippase [Haladaptatus sp. CMAA 1911]|uniref:flippase n=1 Tax=unclassified Haladaptatus TaxID=2622732 RepID=UPI0037544288
MSEASRKSYNTMSDLRKSISAILSGRMIVRISGVVFTPLLVRILTKSQFGTYGVILSLFTVVTVVSQIGLPSAIRKHVAGFTGQNSKQSTLLFGGTGLALLYGLGVGIIVLFVMNLSWVHSQEYEKYLIVLAVAVILRNIFDSFRAGFYGRQQEAIAEKLDIARRLVYITSALVLAVLGFGVLGVFVGYTLAYFVMIPAVVYLVHKEFGLTSLTERTELSNLSGRLVRYGALQAVGGIAALMLYKTDILLINYFRSATETAAYQAALFPAELIWFVPAAIQGAMLQNVARHWSSRNIDAINADLDSSMRYAVLSLILFGVGLLGLSKEFLTIYFGPEYSTSVFPLQILIIGTFFYGINRVIVPVLQATGRLRYNETVTVSALVLNIILNVILIPRFGITGAAIGTGISYTSVVVGSLLILHYTEFRLLRRETAIQLGATLLIFAVPYLTLTTWINLSPFISLIVFPPIGAVLFSSACLVTGIVDIEFVKKRANKLVPIGPT